MVTHVSGLQGKLAGEGVLDTQSPILNVGGAEIAVHGKGIARPRVGSDAVTALNRCGDAGRINCGSLILPGKV